MSMSPEQLTPEYIQRFIEEDSSLWTLKRVDIVEVLRLLHDLGHARSVQNEDQLYEALLDVMYKTRPTGPT